MNIDKMKRKVYAGVDDGAEFALIKNDVVHLIQAHGMSDALCRAHNLGIAKTNEWMLSNAKAVLIPGIWEYQMAVCIKDMDNVQTEQLAEQLKLDAEVA